MDTYRVAVLPGDGTGREVMREALRILSIFDENSPASFDINEIPCGGQYYLETGEEDSFARVDREDREYDELIDKLERHMDEIIVDDDNMEYDSDDSFTSI